MDPRIVTVLLWTTYGVLAFIAGRLELIVLAPVLALVGFFAAWRTMNA